MHSLVREKLRPSLFDAHYFTHQPTLDFIKKALSNSAYSQTSVIDEGCGIKPFRSLFTNTKKYIGTDIKNTGYNDRTCPNWKLKAQKNEFDFLLSTFVLEHTLHLDKTITEMQRVVKPGGTILLIAPFVYPQHEAPHDYWRFSQFSLRELFAYFTIIDLQPSNGYLTTLAVLFNLFINQSIKVKPIKMLFFFCSNVICLILEKVMFHILLWKYHGNLDMVYSKAYYSLPLNYFVIIRNRKK